MSVLIKNRSMPICCYGCWECDEYTDGGWFCVVENRGVEEDFKKTRPQWCPLVELPAQHGRLIDADAIGMNYIHIRGDGMKIYTQRAIDSAPTIIEADEADMDSFIRVFEEDDEEDGMDSFIRILKD